MVREFQCKFHHPISDVPCQMSSERVNIRGKWMQEELNEFYVAEDMYDQADAMIDLIYFALGTLVEMGIKPDEIFDIVHNANMAKLWPDGLPHYNKDGKTIKPAGWKDPKPLMRESIDKTV